MAKRCAEGIALQPTPTPPPPPSPSTPTLPPHPPPPALNNYDTACARSLALTNTNRLRLRQQTLQTGEKMGFFYKKYICNRVQQIFEKFFLFVIDKIKAFKPIIRPCSKTT